MSGDVPQTKPRAYVLVERWGIPAVAALFVVATIGNLLLRPPMEWVPMLIIGPIMGFAGHWMVRLILRFQKFNVLMMSRESYDGFVAAFFWFFLLFLALMAFSFVANGFRHFALLYGSAMAVGTSMGAAREWERRTLFQTKAERRKQK